MSLKQQKQQWDKGEGQHCSSSNAVKGNMNASYLNSDRRHSFPAAIIVVYFERWGGNRLFHCIFLLWKWAFTNVPCRIWVLRSLPWLLIQPNLGTRALHYRLILRIFFFFNNSDFFLTIFIKRRQTLSLSWALKHQKMAAITWSGLTTCLVQGVRTEVVRTDGQTRRDCLCHLPGNTLYRRAHVRDMFLRCAGRSL